MIAEEALHALSGELRDAQPYPGLRPFEREESRFFKGRDEQVEEIIQRLASDSCVVVLGGSGCGKSSIVRAGVIPALRLKMIPGRGDFWRVAICSPGRAPVANLVDALDGLLTPDASGGRRKQIRDVLYGSDGLGGFLPAFKKDIPLEPGLSEKILDKANLLVLIDQFEELFREENSGTAEASALAGFIIDAWRRRDRYPGLYLVLTMRTDDLHRCAEFLDLPEVINASGYLTRRLKETELRQAIVEPPRSAMFRAGLLNGERTSGMVDLRPYEVKVVTELLDAVEEIARDPDHLPLLQHLLAVLWRTAHERWQQDVVVRPEAAEPQINLQDLARALGCENWKEAVEKRSAAYHRGVNGWMLRYCLEYVAEQLYAGSIYDNRLTERQQEIARVAFCLMGEVDDRGNFKRRWTSREEIARSAGLEKPNADVEAVICRFYKDHRLLWVRPSGEIDVSHESLMRNWPRLGKQLEEDRDAGAACQYIVQRYKEWQQARQHQYMPSWLTKWFGLLSAHELERAKLLLAPCYNGYWAERFISGDEHSRDAEATDSQRSKEFLCHSSIFEACRAYLRRSVTKQRWALPALIIMPFLLLSIGAIPFALLSLHQANRAEVEANRAEVARQKATKAQRYAEEQLSQAHWSQGLRARERNNPLQASHHFVRAAKFAADSGFAKNAQLAGMFSLQQVALRTILVHKEAVHGVVWHPKGQQILTWGDNTARLWDWLAGTPLTPFLTHNGPVKGAVFSPDGTRILTWSDDKTARLWKPDSGTALTPPLLHEGAVWSAAFNPDGTRILTWSDDKTARLWESSTGRALPSPWANDRLVRGAVFHPDGVHVLTWHEDHTARLWDPATGTARTPPLAHNDAIWGAAFNPDGSRILTWSDDNTARLWDSATGVAAAPPLGHERRVRGAMFSANGSRVLTWSDDGTARLWDSTTGVALTPPLQHQQLVWGATFNADEGEILTWSADGTAQLWNSQTGAALFSPLPHAGSRGPAFSPDGKQIMTWSADQTARIWDSTTGSALTPPLPHAGAVAGAEFSPGGQQFITWSEDGTVRLWDRLLGAANPLPLPHPGQVKSAQFSPDPDGDRILSWGDDKTVRLWDSATGAPLTPPLAHPHQIQGAAFSPDGDRVLTHSTAGKVRLWDSATGASLPLPIEPEYRVKGVIYSPDGRHLLTWSADNRAHLWDMTTGTSLALSRDHTDALWGAAFGPKGERLLTWSADGTARVWDTATGTAHIPPLTHQGPVRGAAFSQDGAQILTWSIDKTAQLWDSATGKALTPPLDHQEPVTGAQISSDGKRIITWRAGGTARVWDSFGKLLNLLRSHTEAIRGAAFSPEGDQILTWGMDQTARLWDSAAGTALIPPLALQEPVIGAVFSQDGHRILAWDKKGWLQVWRLPVDDGAQRAHLDLQLEAQTGTQLNQRGDLEVLSPEDWRAKKQQYADRSRP